MLPFLSGVLFVFDPLGDLIGRFVHAAAADGKAAGDHRTGRGLPNVLLRAGKAAALVGAEGMDGLAGKIVVFEKGVFMACCLFHLMAL